MDTMNFLTRAGQVLLLAALLTAGTSLVLTPGGSPAAAQSTPTAPLNCLQVFTPGNTQANLLVVPAQGDNADDYELVRDYVAANGSFQQVTVLSGQLSTTVPIENHWVRSRNAQGSSAFVACETYERISFIDASTPQDFRRPSENIAFGLDGNGNVQAGSDNGNAFGIFTGADGDIVVTDASNAPELAPNGGKQAWRVRFRLAQVDLEFLQDESQISWNLMQRGLADDPGGQLKISLIAQPDNSVRVECFASDFAGATDNIRTVSSFDVAAQTITNGLTPWMTATCLMDGTGNADGPGTADSLQIVVNGIGDPEELDGDFGELLPSAPNRCGFGTGTELDANLFPGGIGHVVTVGNKPACSSSNTNDDAFIGHVDFAEIWNLTTIAPPQPTQFCNGLPVTVDLNLGQVPTQGADVILGTPLADLIVALGGNDTICGEGGNDTINGGPGSDFVDAGPGTDTVFGLDGNDTVNGGDGADVIIVGAGDDTVNGGDGNDVINGGAGADTLNGDIGDDEIFGQDGNDTITGGNGNDLLTGLSGVDTIRGGGGNDVINGGSGNDDLFGDAGDDVVFGLTGDDFVNGAAGNDQLFGQIGEDVVIGGSGDDLVLGNEDDDVLNGDAGDDTLNGGPGDDILQGGADDDQLFGDGNLAQAGDDELTGGDGLDVLLGFAGNDTLNALQGGPNTVNGGPDIDSCLFEASDTVFNCE